jgi:hypothetical protein
MATFQFFGSLHPYQIKYLIFRPPSWDSKFLFPLVHKYINADGSIIAARTSKPGYLFFDRPFFKIFCRFFLLWRFACPPQWMSVCTLIQQRFAGEYWS